MITISFYPKFYDLREHDEREAQVAEYRKWFELHGQYGRMFMWDIGKKENYDGYKGNEVIGVRIFDDEIGTLFKLMHEV